MIVRAVKKAMEERGVKVNLVPEYDHFFPGEH